MGVIGAEQKIDAVVRHHVKAFVKQLERHRGRGTELVTVYVPSGYDLNAIIGQLQQEQGTAENIKSKQTRTNVIDALERMIQHLRGVGRTPPNGLAAFSGNVAEREGQSDVRVWSIEMPVPSSQRLYRCDKEFILEPLREIVEHENTYGLVVLDRRDAMLGLLKGKTIVPLVQTHSEVPGKHKSGGQCCTQNTMVQTATGDIIKLADTHNPLSVKSVSEAKEIDQSPILDKWEVEKDSVYTITTRSPRLQISCSKDHVFFARRRGIEEVPAEDLKVGEWLVMPERIEIKGELQKLEKKDFFAYAVPKHEIARLMAKRKQLGLSQKKLGAETQLGQSTISAFERGILHLSENVLRRIYKSLQEEFNQSKFEIRRQILLPDKLSEDVAQFVGYFLGDGSKEVDRISFFEQREDVAKVYVKLSEQLFNVYVSNTFREDKNYWSIRVYGQPIVKLLEDNFPELRKTENSQIPAKILESPPEVVAAFLRGLYDAEGFVHNGVGLAMNNQDVIHALQMLLLRFGILSALHEYDNRKNPWSEKMKYKVQIADKESLEIFANRIGFSAKDKQEKLLLFIQKKDGRNRTRQILPPGSEIRKIIEEHGYNIQSFPRVTDFFRDKRMLSKEAFRRSIVAYAPDAELKRRLTLIADMPLLPVQIASIEVSQEKVEMVDISTGHGNFIANGLLVHNSAVRFERLREGATIEHFKKIADYMKDQFLPMGEGLKGIILGGPGVTINKFMGLDYITGDLKKKILGTKDLSYTGEFGLQELLEKSEDILAEEEVADEKKVMQKFFYELSKDTGLAAYGRDDVLRCIGYGAVDTVLLSEALDDEVILEFEQAAEKMGSSVKIISTQTREGVQLKEMGKIAAILRYAVGTH